VLWVNYLCLDALLRLVVVDADDAIVFAFCECVRALYQSDIVREMRRISSEQHNDASRQYMRLLSWAFCDDCCQYSGGK